MSERNDRLPAAAAIIWLLFISCFKFNFTTHIAIYLYKQSFHLLHQVEAKFVESVSAHC